MRIIKFAILITFLFNSTAYPYQDTPDNLRVPMMGDKTNKDRLESAGKLATGIKPVSGYGIRLASREEGYKRIARELFPLHAAWGNEKAQKEFIRSLRAGEKVFEFSYSFFGGNTTIDLVRGIRTHYWTEREYSGYYTTDGWSDTSMSEAEAIRPDILALARETLGKRSDFITRFELWKLGLSQMTEDAIERCLYSLANNGNAPKAAIVKKLVKLQQKRPETVAIIREKALELLEIDEADFKDALQPFIGDYIALREAYKGLQKVRDQV